MDINEVLELGVKKNIITANQKNELLNLLEIKNFESPPIPLIVKILYYIGGFTMLGAMIVLMSHTIQHSSYAVILILGTIYAVLFFMLGEFLWKRNEKLPAEILYFLFITAIAFIITDIEKMTGFFPHFSDFNKFSNYYEMCRLPVLAVSGLTIIVNTILQKFRNASLLAITTIVPSYFIYMVCAHYIFNNKIWDSIYWTNCDLLFSIMLVIIAFIKDKMTKADYSKWMYFIGAVGIFKTMMTIFNEYDSTVVSIEIVQVKMFILCIIYFTFGIIIQRKPFTIIGILGIIEYIMFLEFHLIKENILLLTSSILTTGLLILYAGVLYNKNSEKIIMLLEKMLPEKIRLYLPSNRKER